jgi:methionyl-tRNA synthetase
MLCRYRGGVVPASGVQQLADEELQAIAARLPEETAAALDRFDFRAALGALWGLVARANGYVEESAPWTLAKREKAGDEEAARRLDAVLYTLAESLRLLSLHLSPYIPDGAGKIATQLGIATEDRRAYAEAARWGGLAPGTHVARAEPIFPKLGSLKQHV